MARLARTIVVVHGRSWISARAMVDPHLKADSGLFLVEKSDQGMELTIEAKLMLGMEFWEDDSPEKKHPPPGD